MRFSALMSQTISLCLGVVNSIIKGENGMWNQVDKNLGLFMMIV
jgi:hypothetical protein